MFVCRLAFLLFIHGLPFVFVLGERSQKNLYILGLFPMGGAFDGGLSIQPAVEVAIDYVNRDENFLPGYQLNLVWDDTKCYEGEAIRILTRRFCENKTFIIVLGAGCSAVSETVAQATHLWNLVQISFTSTSVPLSDEKRFPMFFRVVVSERQVNYALVGLIKQFNWTKVAIIHHTNNYFVTKVADMETLMNKDNIQVTTKVHFSDDSRNAVRQLKETDSRIIIGGLYEKQARKVLCEAFKIRFGGSKIVWLLPGYNKFWWKKDDTDCSAAEILSVLGNSFSMYTYLQTDSKMQDDNDITQDQFTADYFQKVDDKKILGYDFAPTGYDALWAIARALNATMADLKNTEFGLEDFSYTNKYIGDLIKKNMVKVDFKSLSGRVSFFENGDSRRALKIMQLQVDKTVIVGFYNQLEVGDKFIWKKSTPLFWPKGIVTRDSIQIVKTSVQVSQSLHIIMCVLSALGILLAIHFLVLNIRHQNTRVVKMSSPNINNLILLGCVILYSFVFLNGHDVRETPALCEAPKDFYLYFNIAMFTTINVIIMAMWAVIDPSRPAAHSLEHLKKIDLDEDQMEIPVLWYCTTNMYFQIVLLAIQGILLVFGVFLAYTTRKVSIPALNDSKAIGMCIYNVILLTLVGLPLSLILDDDVDIMFGGMSALFIAGTTSTQCLIFIPKVKQLKKYMEGDRSQCRVTTSQENKFSEKQCSHTDFTSSA
ncbi:gamma-aminobutyric acid type B receptor subunit 1-like isoform X2 [Gigantopelta aegis]|uniref:gamma-aminobutyric acid type B receptor subunit 1-like isoform X2 n=1 Tax=Gigantopelta aegis TaxID=1735272 RepID=UPI001B88CB35|nr:gamma-aminobutyric acid type B receptor subunit 1-like isoform X2 [Gigantopelta aegis]